MRDQLAMYGGDDIAADYMNVLDDSEADFAADFADTDTDIKPVADPSSVTRMQQMAKAQLVLTIAQGGRIDALEADKFAMEVAGIPDIERFMPKGQPQPDPVVMAKVAEAMSRADGLRAKAALDQAKTMQTVQQTAQEVGEAQGYADGVTA